MKDLEKEPFTIFGIVYEFSWLSTQVSIWHAKSIPNLFIMAPFLENMCISPIANNFASKSFKLLFIQKTILH